MSDEREKETVMKEMVIAALNAAAKRVVDDHSIEFQDSTIHTHEALYVLGVLEQMAKDLNLPVEEIERAKARVLMPVNVEVVWPQGVDGNAVG